MRPVYKVIALLTGVALLMSACQPVMAQPGASASTLDSKDFILRYFAALNEDKSATTVDEYVADEVLKHHIELFETAFPGYQLTAEDMIAEGNRIFVRALFEGTHEGDLMGIPPTGKPVTIPIALTYLIENGKIVDHWMLSDNLTMMQQIGAIPAPTTESEEASHPLVDRIELPVGFRPEGITRGSGSAFYVGSLGCCGTEAPDLMGGTIYRGDLGTGQGEILVEPQPGQMAVGLAYDPRTNYLFEAGGLSKNLLVFDADSGDLVTRFLLSDSTFPNDLAVTPDAVYITDSFSDKLYRLPLGEEGALPGEDSLVGFPLGGDYAVGDMSYPFQANGIVASPDGGWLIVVNSNTGLLYRVDTLSGDVRTIDLGGQILPYGDGLVLDATTLYVVQNYLNKLTAVELNADWTAGAVVAEITNPEFSTPTTAVQIDGSIYVVNGRYEDSEPLAADSPDVEYAVVRIDKVADPNSN